jgi:carboxyvinyl-carboxyphosphonate phosphorylmutase
MSRARERFRAILAREECTPAAPIFDPLSAQIANIVGWEVCKLSGTVAKGANLGVPDVVPMVNMTDVADYCRRITRVVDVSLTVDADNGGGGVLSILRTVQELEAAGVSAIEIEDDVVPRRFDPAVARHSQLIPEDEQVRKLKAAVAARRDPLTVIVARTSALTFLPREEALDRIREYSRTGAEAIMLPGLPPRGLADVEAVHTVSNLPIFITGLPWETVQDKAFLATNKIRIRYCGQPVYKMAVKVIYEALSYMKDGGNHEDLKDREASQDQLNAVIRVPELMDWQRKYDPS